MNEHLECCGQTEVRIHYIFWSPICVKCAVCGKELWVHPAFRESFARIGKRRKEDSE
jgi:hypothetical protein